MESYFVFFLKKKTNCCHSLDGVIHDMSKNKHTWNVFTMLVLLLSQTKVQMPPAYSHTDRGTNYSPYKMTEIIHQLIQTSRRFSTNVWFTFTIYYVQSMLSVAGKR